VRRLSQDSERIRSLVTFKKRLEKRLEELEAETVEVKETLDTVNSLLLEKGFKRGDIKEVSKAPIPVEVILPKQPVEPKETKQVTQIPVAGESETVIPLRAMNDEPLAILYFEKQSVHVMPDESKKFSVNTPPFGNFLVERVFAKMQEKDAELVRAGQLKQDKMFTYTIVQDDDLIREIVIKNVDEERLKELKSSIRWTFEKMHEKVKN
jgi:hypothetical protein